MCGIWIWRPRIWGWRMARWTHSFTKPLAVMNVNTTQITNVYVKRHGDREQRISRGVQRRTRRSCRTSNAGTGTAYATSNAHSAGGGAGAAGTCRKFRIGCLVCIRPRSHGRPASARLAARPVNSAEKGVVTAKAAGGTYHAPAMSPKEARPRLRPETGVERLVPAEKTSSGKTGPRGGQSARQRRATKASNHPCRGAAQEQYCKTGEGDHGTGEHSSGKHYQGECGIGSRAGKSPRGKTPTPAPASFIREKRSKTETPARESAPRAEKAPENRDSSGYRSAGR